MLNRHFLQSPTWEKYSQLENYQTFRAQGDNFEYLALEYTTPLGNYLFCPYGPTLNPENPTTSLEHALDSLRKLARERHAFFIRIEPTQPFPAEELKSLGLVKSHDLDPAHTWTLDLTQPESDITSAIDKNKFRSWRIREKKGVQIRTSTNPDDISILTNFLASVSARNGFIPQNSQHLRNQVKSGFATLYIAELQAPTPDSQADNPSPASSSTPIAAALVYDYDGTRFYAHAAADQAYRKLDVGSTLLVQMILDAKNQGAHTFDFWGITTSDDPHHPWYGFTKFKKSFGGHQVDYSGTWDLPLHRVKYRLYQLLRRANRTLRKKSS